MNTFFKIIIIALGVLFLQVAMALDAHTNNSVVLKIIQNQMIFDRSTVESVAMHTPKITGDSSYGVYLRFKAPAAKKLDELAQLNIGKQADIILDGTVISSSTIQGKLGREILVAGLTKEQADQFIKSLKLTG